MRFSKYIFKFNILFIYLLDIDECRQNPCADNSICRNLPGTFECKCLEGYDGNAREACTRGNNFIILECMYIFA